MMQTDILASAAITSSGQATDQLSNQINRARVKAIYIVPSGTAGSVSLKDGGSSGTSRLALATVASATQPTYLELPAEGIVFVNNIYVTVSNVTSVVLFYA
jgi:hypothetical protein